MKNDRAQCAADLRALAKAVEDGRCSGLVAVATGRDLPIVGGTFVSEEDEPEPLTHDGLKALVRSSVRALAQLRQDTRHLWVGEMPS